MRRGWGERMEEWGKGRKEGKWWRWGGREEVDASELGTVGE